MLAARHRNTYSGYILNIRGPPESYSYMRLSTFEIVYLLMLKHSLALVLIATGALCNGQNFGILPSQQVDCEISATEVNEFNIVFSTGTPEAITYSWELLENSIPLDWDYSLCDYTSCHIGIPESAIMTRISLDEATNGTQGFLKMNVLIAPSNGSYVARFYVYDSADRNRGDTVAFNFTNGTVAVSDLVKNTEVNLYPNPTLGYLIVETENRNSEITVVDLTGRVMMQKNLVGIEGHRLDLSDMRSGVYMVLLRSEGVLRKSRVLVSY